MTDSLIAKLEAAAEGSRELDAEICLEIRSYPKDWATTLPGYSLEYFIAWSECAPRYTTSLDVALSLVPEGWWLTLDRYVLTIDQPPNQREWRVWLRTMVGDLEGDGPTYRVERFATAPTPALAMCAAALKARSQS